MHPILSEVYIDGEKVDYDSLTFKEQGGNTANTLTFNISKKNASFRKYWNKEVTFFFDKSDAYPLFRGRVTDTTFNENSINYIAVDVLGMLTGPNKPTVFLTDDDNIDGLTVGAAITKLIRMANLDSIVGTDLIGDTTPVFLFNKMRGEVVIYQAIKDMLKQTINVTQSIPLENIIKVYDDGNKGQLVIESLKDTSTSTAVKVYNYETNIINFSVQNRKIPTTIVVKGKTTSATFRHSSAAAALGENYTTITNPTLESKAECQDFAQKIFEANLETQFEYILDTFDGVYLRSNDVIHISDESTDTTGNFRVIGKTLTSSGDSFRLQLTINKRPPIIAQFLRQSS
jgi:hypothetical protein